MGSAEDLFRGKFWGNRRPAWREFEALVEYFNPGLWVEAHDELEALVKGLPEVTEASVVSAELHGEGLPGDCDVRAEVEEAV